MDGALRALHGMTLTFLLSFRKTGLGVNTARLLTQNRLDFIG